MGLPQRESNQHDRSTPQRKKPSHWERAEQRSNRTYIEVEKGHDRSVTRVTRLYVTSHRTQGTSCYSWTRISNPVPTRQNQNTRHFFAKVFRRLSFSSIHRLMMSVKSSLLARSLCTCNTTAWLRRAWVIEKRR